MWHKAIYAVILTSLLALSLLLLPGDQARAARAEMPGEVRILNFPEVQEVEGEVEVKSAIPAASLASFPETLVAPTGATDPTQWAFVGRLDAAGWRHAVLSLAGEVRGRGGAGEVGAVLVPDVAMAARAFEDGQVLLFPLKVSTEVAPDSLWVASEQPEVRLAFPRYRVYLYNASERSVALRLHAYRTQ